MARSGHGHRKEQTVHRKEQKGAPFCVRVRFALQSKIMISDGSEFPTKITREKCEAAVSQLPGERLVVEGPFSELAWLC